MDAKRQKVFAKMWKEARGEEDVIVMKDLPRKMVQAAWFDHDIRFTEDELKELILEQIIG